MYSRKQNTLSEKIVVLMWTFHAYYRALQIFKFYRLFSIITDLLIFFYYPCNGIFTDYYLDLGGLKIGKNP